MKRLLFSLVIFPIALFAEGGLPDKPYIYVVGNAELEKPADLVTLKFDLVGRAPDQPKANEDVQTKAIKIFALLKDHKIGDNDIIAEDLRSEPEFEQDENYSKSRGKLVGYKVTRPFQIRVRDISAFPKLVNDLLGLGGTEFSEIDGGLSKEKEMEPELWQKALTNAREQADKSLKPLNMKIDAVFAVSPVSFPEIQGKIFATGVTRLGVRGEEAGYAEGPAGPRYEVAPIKLSQTIHVIYLISPAK